jgi:tryptophan halogenase
MTEPIRSLVIVGGGTAGWMAAASLQQHFLNTPLKITLIESSKIDTVGVGEATIPTIRRFYHNLGMSDQEVLQATQGTCKLGIQFNDWHRPGSSFIHPFGLFGQDVKGIGFHHFWLKLREQGDTTPIGAYSLGASLAVNNKFTFPSATPPSSLSIFDWALHFDASLFAKHMRQFATSKGCKHIDAMITEVTQRPEDGFIESLRLDNGETVRGDLFIDCSGFRSLLLDQTLEVGYEDWSEWLFCDSAVVAQTKNVGSPSPYTKVNARDAGWQWRIPLRSRTGNGHVYSSRFIDDQQAEDALTSTVEGELLTEPRKLTFRPGRRTRSWHKNCIALGLSSGFLEPLESTSIALIETGIERIKQLFPDRRFEQSCIDEFNEVSALEYERVRDFIILHYKATARSDTDFWRECGAMQIPETLQKKIDLFKARGYFLRYRWEMFHPASWLAIYTGFELLPDSYDPAVDSFDSGYIARSLGAMKASLEKAVKETPPHQEFLDTLDGGKEILRNEKRYEAN